MAAGSRGEDSSGCPLGHCQKRPAPSVAPVPHSAMEISTCLSNFNSSNLLQVAFEALFIIVRENGSSVLVFGTRLPDQAAHGGAHVEVKWSPADAHDAGSIPHGVLTLFSNSETSPCCRAA